MIRVRPRPRRPTVLAAALLALAALPGARSAFAHTPPPIYLTYTLGEEELTLEATIADSLFLDWAGVTMEQLKALPPGEAAARLQGRLDEWGRVSIDRVEVRGQVVEVRPVEFEDHGVPWAFAVVKASWGVKGQVREVAAAWTKFDVSTGWYLDFIEAEMYTPSGGVYLEFTREEPEYVWHAPNRAVARIRPPPPPPEPETISLPVASLAVLLGLALAVPFLHFGRAPRRLAWGTVAAFGAAAVAVSGLARTEVRAPWGERYRPPSVEEAAAVFESLHRNIYRAFDYASEDDIYDTLARSVSGDLLEEVYAEVFQGLILEDEGGAVSTIRAVNIAETSVSFPEDEDARWFDVTCTWRVHGVVGHWGHTHHRVNEYRARYRLSLLEAGWRITGMEVLEQERVPLDQVDGWTDVRPPR